MGREQNWAGRVSGCAVDLNQSLPTAQGALDKDERSPTLGPHNLSLVLPAWTVLAEEYTGKMRPQLEHVVFPEGIVARSCQPNALLEAEQAATLFKAVSKSLTS